MKKIAKKATLSVAAVTALTTIGAVTVISTKMSEDNNNTKSIKYLQNKQMTMSNDQIIQEEIQNRIKSNGVTTNKELNKIQKEVIQNNTANTLKNTSSAFNTYTVGQEKITKVKMSFKLLPIHLKSSGSRFKKNYDSSILYNLLASAMFENGEK
ncbi:MAG: hypothetical protein GY793_08325 [Proteobacteria bacterium]|nr:hypothetical protein [Pseudomonadota bacterium]